MCAIKDYKVPNEVFWGRKPDISHLKEFGKNCWVLQQDGKNSKLNPKSWQFIFVGVADGTKGYRYYNSQTHQILTSRNIIFEIEDKEMDTVEITHPAPLEGESGPNSKQTSDEEHNQAPAPVTDHLPDMETLHHASPSHIYQYLGNGHLTSLCSC